MAPAETVQLSAILLLAGEASRFVGAGGSRLVISMARAADVLVALVALPAYWAVMLCDPMARLLVVRLAWNDPFKALVPSSVVPS